MQIRIRQIMAQLESIPLPLKNTLLVSVFIYSIL